MVGCCFNIFVECVDINYSIGKVKFKNCFCLLIKSGPCASSVLLLLAQYCYCNKISNNLLVDDVLII